MNVNVPDLASRAMLVSLKIGQWSGRKLDRKITREVLDQKGAADEAGRWNKHLVPKAALEGVTKAVSKARSTHYELTLPWSDEGQRILTARGRDNYDRHMLECQNEFELAVPELIRAYPDIKEEARGLLGETWNEEDYPQVDDLARRFYFKRWTSPLPTADDFRVSLSDEQVETIKRQIDEATASAVTAAQKDLWRQLSEVLTAAATTLRDPQKIFRDSLVGNINDLCGRFPDLMLVDDPALKTFAEAAKDLASIEPKVLRVSPTIRADVAKTAGELVEKMAAYM